MAHDINNEFLALQPDFFHYMVNFGEMSPKAARDYITRLRFLSAFYRLDSCITLERISEIIDCEKMQRHSRTKYSSIKSISDFNSGLKKFYAFLQHDYNEQCERAASDEMQKIINSPTLTRTEKETIVKARVGQGSFRRNLLAYWKGCSFTRCTMSEMLVASHIKLLSSR